MSHLSIRFAALASNLSWLAVGGALAQVAAPADPLEQIAPHERRAYIEQLTARQRAARMQSAEVAADATPPALLAFESATSLNVSKADARFKVAVKATDNSSGVRSLYFSATGPSGQQVYAEAHPGYPTKSVNVLGGFNPINRFLEPGTWTFDYAYGYDVANNYFFVDEAELAAFGNRTFTVVNNGGYDRTAPLLTSGRVITIAVSLASHQPGTTQDRFAGMSLNATDAGNGEVSGVYRAYASFCMLTDASKCIYLSGNINASGQASAPFTAGTQVSAARGNVPGAYELNYVYVYDWAGNYTYLKSNKFGGPVDFSTLFPMGTVIRLDP